MALSAKIESVALAQPLNKVLLQRTPIRWRVSYRPSETDDFRGDCTNEHKSIVIVETRDVSVIRDIGLRKHVGVSLEEAKPSKKQERRSRASECIAP